jgi:hypothetical protein
MPTDAGVWVGRPVTTVWQWLKYQTLDGKDAWLTPRQRTGLKFVSEGKPIPADLLRQLTRRQLVARGGDQLSLTDKGRRVLALLTQPASEEQTAGQPA